MEVKHVLIETEKARVLIVDLPADVTGKLIISNIQVDNDLVELTGNSPRFLCSLPPGTWLPAGKLGEVPEEVAAKIVDETEWSGWGITFYSNYLNNKPGQSFTKATISLMTLTEANVKLENKLGPKPIIEDYLLNPKDPEHLKMINEDHAGQKPSWRSIFRLNYKAKIEAWQAEEETVYRNPFLFFELKEK